MTKTKVVRENAKWCHWKAKDENELQKFVAT